MCSCTAQESKSVQHGNFTIQRIIQTEKGSGSVQNKQYDTRSYLVEYRILYRGKKIKFPSSLVKKSGYNFPWRVYIIKDAPIPALLAGSENMFLITEENNKVNILRLNHLESDFGSIQWLDSNHGQPGNEIQILDVQNDNYIDSSLVLEGGKHVLINRFTILNIPTLARYSIKKNTRGHREWTLSLASATEQEAAVGFSSRFKQLVFRAIKLDVHQPGKYQVALAAFDYTADTMNILPFSRTDLRIESLDHVNSRWVSNYFDWDTGGTLRLKNNIQPAAWLGKLNFPDKDFISYELYPAKETMVTVFLNFLKEKYKSAGYDSGLNIVNETDPRSILLTYRLTIGDKMFHLTYNKEEMKLIFDRHFNESHSESYKDMITSIAVSFNNDLSQKKHQEHFGRYKDE
jgi:hypothetical protein